MIRYCTSQLARSDRTLTHAQVTSVSDGILFALGVVVLFWSGLHQANTVSGRSRKCAQVNAALRFLPSGLHIYKDKPRVDIYSTQTRWPL
jgi:hypothetical protein